MIQHGHKLDKQKNCKGKQEHQTERLHLSEKNETSVYFNAPSLYHRVELYFLMFPPLGILLYFSPLKTWESWCWWCRFQWAAGRKLLPPRGRWWWSTGRPPVDTRQVLRIWLRLYNKYNVLEKWIVSFSSQDTEHKLFTLFRSDFSSLLTLFLCSCVSLIGVRYRSISLSQKSFSP